MSKSAFCHLENKQRYRLSYSGFKSERQGKTEVIAHSDIERAIRTLADLRIGFCFELSGILCIRELDSGKYAVSLDCYSTEEWEKLFYELDEAIDLFISTRIKHRIGRDFQIKPLSMGANASNYENL